MPKKFCALIRAFHTDLKVKIAMNGQDGIVDSTTGVKQGCTLAPILFTVYFQACVEIIEKRFVEARISFQTFRSKPDFMMTG